MKEKHCENCGGVMNSSGRKTCSNHCRNELRAKTMSKKGYVLTCKECCEEFRSSNHSSLYCDRQHFSPCQVCGKDFEINPRTPKPKACSWECRGKLINSDEANEKRMRTYLERYGVKHTFMSEEVKGKIRETMIERYGGSSTYTSPELMKKALETTVEKYGTPFPRQRNKSVRLKAERTNLERYGFINPFASESVKMKIRETVREKYGDGVIPHSRISSVNRELAEFFIKNSLPEVRFEQPFGKFYSDLKVGDTLIDIHPTATHNSAVPFACLISGCDEGCSLHDPIDMKYHFERALEAKKNNLSLLQFYDWDSRDNILNIVSGKEGEIKSKFSARKLKSVKISQKDANRFLKESHVQGAAKGQTHCYALAGESSEILAVATFGKSRFNKKFEYEFIRYAVKKDTLIHGGSGKLFKEFIKDAKPESVISYVDFNHTTRELTFLNSVGFQEENPTGPSTIWFNRRTGKVVKETSLLSIGADRILGTSYGRKEVCGMDNRQIMLKEGFLPVSTAGNRVFTWWR